MVHGRMIRPAVAGAVPVKVDEGSIKDIPGAKVVWDKGFLGVVADKEWDAIQAAQKLKVEWSQVEPPFPEQASLYDHIRKATVRKRSVDKENGNVDEAFKNAAKVIEAEYEWPFQSHASMGPACALVEIKDGQVTCWSGTQKSHFVQQGVGAHARCAARQGPRDLGDGPRLLRPQRCRRLRHGCGRAGESGRQAGAPAIHARTRAPAGTRRARPRSTRRGQQSTPPARSPPTSSPARPSRGWTSTPMAGKPLDTLAGQTRGVGAEIRRRLRRAGESYAFDNKRMAWETIPPLLDRSSPLRSAHLRDPVGPQIHFASESFIDEVAAAVNADPIEFRLRHIKEPRDVAVIKAAADKAKWETRPSPRRDQSGNKVSGRGIAYAQRNGTRVAIIAEVDIDRSTGKIWARKFTVAHDCGQIINPDGLVKCIEGNIVQGVSRTLWEEVTFDRKSGDQRGLDQLSDPRHHRDAGRGRCGADQPSRDRAHWRRRTVDPAGGGGDRQRHLRRHRRAHPPGAVLARSGEGRSVVSREIRSIPSWRDHREAVFLFHSSHFPNVRYWHLADIGLCAAHVCF